MLLYTAGALHIAIKHSPPPLILVFVMHVLRPWVNNIKYNKRAALQLTGGSDGVHLLHRRVSYMTCRVKVVCRSYVGRV